MRTLISRLKALGPLPSEKDSQVQQLREYEKLISGIHPPITDEEARVLVNLLGPDGCFGAMYTLIFLIETAPGWPLLDLLDGNSEGIRCLRIRARNAGYEVPQSNQREDLELN